MGSSGSPGNFYHPIPIQLLIPFSLSYSVLYSTFLQFGAFIVQSPRSELDVKVRNIKVQWLPEHRALLPTHPSSYDE